MSDRAARYTALCIAVVTMGMLGYVSLKTHLFKLSYAIQEQEQILEEDRERLRALRYEISSMKALSTLETSGAKLNLTLENPSQVNHLDMPRMAAPSAPIESFSFPQKFLSRFTFVPEALAKTEEKNS